MEAQRVNQQDAAEGRGGHDSARILFLDKDLGSFAPRCAQLLLAGWYVVHTCDEMETLSVARNQRVDLALLHMPVSATADMDLANVIRRVSPAAYLPVMILTDTVAERKRCQFLDGGADDVVSQDTSGEEVVARARALLRVKALHDQLADSQQALMEAIRRERQLLAKVRRDNEYLRELAATDPLTHVQNVRAFRGLLDHEFKVAVRYNHPLSLLMLDVDHFKVVNDMHGHPSGDYVLKELAVILQQSVRESDVVSRTGGEEFSVILPQAGPDDAAGFAERIRREVHAREFTVYGRNIHITASVGSASYPADAEITEPDMLLYFADQALLAAKERGRDRVVAFGRMDMAVRWRSRWRYQMARQMRGGVSGCQHVRPIDAAGLR
jgi:diguanylate cyclase (GGDEF)-like protein